MKQDEDACWENTALSSKQDMNNSGPQAVLTPFRRGACFLSDYSRKMLNPPHLMRTKDQAGSDQTLAGPFDSFS